MEALLGATLTTKEGDKPTGEALAGKEVVLLYFSAHWCGPCRGFTPKLVDIRNELQAKGKACEVVFVSSDRDEDGFKEYYGSMPWLALPFANREKKAELSKKYKVSGIPTLVVVDAVTGALINKDGRSAVQDLEAYPWKPPTVAEVLAEVGSFVDGKGAVVTPNEIASRGGYLALYFSAHWCPPCKAFTPELVKSYNAVKAAGHDLTLAFVSSDRDQETFDEYFGEMPWHSVPFEKRDAKEKLSAAFEVQGIPTFVVLRLEGDKVEVVNKEARSAVSGEEEPGERFPWAPELVPELSECDSSIEDTPSFIAFMEEAGDQWDAIEAQMRAVAEKVKASTPEGDEMPFRFWAAKEVGGVSQQVRKLCKLSRPKAGEVSLVLLNLAEGGAYHVAPVKAITADALQSIMDGFGSIEWAKISK